MCGIAGIYNLDRKPVFRSHVKKMTDAMIHRGPNDEGIYVNKNIGMGHRRLSIIDVSDLGHQPMSDNTGDTWISYNGEIYNFLEIKKKLVKLGYHFKSRTDTEVILYSYKEWGIECVKMFNGMFAFALWDKNNKKLFLVRDRFGIKPLYYFCNNKKIVFASEIKPLLKTSGVPREVCLNALKEYFTFQNTYSDKTFFNEIKILSPASILEIDSNYKLNIRQYWKITFNPGKEKFKWYVDKLKNIFENVIKSQLASDVPIGSYLSGGIDTGAIVATARRYLPNMMTFTGGFDLTMASGIEMLFDERKDAELMANIFDAQSYQMVMRPRNLEMIMPKLIWHLEDPKVGMTYHNFYIAELASKFVRVVLGGTGGDEIFGGYPWRYRLGLNNKNDADFNKNLYNYWQRLVRVDDHKDFFTSSVYSGTKNYDLFTLFNNIFSDWEYSGDNEELNKCLFFDIKTFLRGLLLMEDKISMAHSMEARVPFLDNKLVDFMLNIPFKYKVDLNILMHNNDLSSLGGKKILRKAIKGLVPEKIIKKEKQGFSAPDASWYRGPSLNYVKSILLNKKSLNRGYFQPKFINKIICDHLSGRFNHRLLIWSLLCFEWWNRIFIDEDFDESLIGDINH